MRKLPVFKTFGNAVAFAVGKYFTVLRLSWLPLVAFYAAMVAVGYVVQAVVGEGAGLPQPGFFSRHLDDILFGYAVTIVAQVIAFTSVVVAVHKVVLFDDRNPGDYFVFAFGWTEVLFVVMSLLSFLGFLAVMASIVGPAILLVAQGDPSFFAKFEDWPENMPQMVESGDFGKVMGAYALGWLVLLYFCLRLAVWPPAIVATRRLALGEAWALTRGNVLRLFGLFMLIAVVMWIVMAAFMFGFMFHVLPKVTEATAHVGVGFGVRYPFAPFGPLFWLGYLFLYVFSIGLTVATLSYSYKALIGVDAKEPLPQG